MIKAAVSAAFLIAGGVAVAASLSHQPGADDAVTVVDAPRPALSVTATATSTAASTNWTECAREDEVCAVMGPVLVRYGAGNSMVIKEVGGQFRCSNAEFGDPAYGVAKSCSYVTAPTASEWVPCAGEGQTCRVPASTLVRYGAGGRFAYKDASGSIACGNQTFGDPAWGMVKTCAYRAVPSRPVVAPPPFGLYVGNPDGNSPAAMAQFQTRWDASVRQLNRSPQFFGTFTDFSKEWKDWPANASWFAWSFKQSGRGANLKPVIGIKLSTTAYWNRQADAFREIIAGRHDQTYRDVVTAWRDAGYKELRFRISYEFNGSFMPDNFGSDAETLDLWRRAFARVADVMHAVPDVKVIVVWNPVNINHSANSVADAYPGDRYVDVIASDIYSTLYPFGFHDWSGGADAKTLAEWAANPANRKHFWDHPGGTPWSTDGRGWGIVQALAFATLHKKPFAVSETGVGGDNITNGLADDPVFPAHLRTRLDEFVTAGGTIDHVIIWDYDASDGAWRFTDVPSKTATARAWTAFVN